MNTGRYGEKRSGRKGIKKETDIGREVTRSAKNGKKERKSTWRERERRTIKWYMPKIANGFVRV